MAKIQVGKMRWPAWIRRLIWIPIPSPTNELTMGMLLSVILTMQVKIALDSHDDTAWLGKLLGPNPDETDLADTWSVRQGEERRRTMLLRPYREAAARIAWILVILAVPGLGIVADLYLISICLSLRRRRIVPVPW